MSISECFGNRLSAIRRELHLSQEEFAFKCGMQASHIGQLERGEKSPTLDTLYKISVGIDCPLIHLLDFDADIELPNAFDKTINKAVACLQGLDEAERSQILKIIKTFVEKQND